MASRIIELLLIVSIALTLPPGTARAQEVGQMGGAGIGLKQLDDGRIIIESVAPEGPAAKAGLQPGDCLVGVDRRAVADLNGSQLVDAIRGPVGSKVVLVYVRGNAEPASATVIRAPLVNPAAPKPPAAAAPKPPAAAAPAEGAKKFTRQAVKDPAAENRSAVTYLLPEGWQAQGQIVWMHEFSVLANLRLHLSDAGTGLTIDWLPTQHFSWTDQFPDLIKPGSNWMGAILATPITDPAQFVEGFWAPQVVPHLRNLRPVAREEYPKIAHEAVANDPGWKAQAVRLRYAFEQEGKPWEQDVYFTLAYAPVNNGLAMWNVQRAFTCSGPKGRLDAGAVLIKTVIANANFTSEWLAVYSVVQQLRRQGLQQEIADDAAFGRQLAQYNARIQQLGQEMHEQRMKSFDRIAESQREYLGGVETYTDPYQRQGVYMPAGYKEYWVNQKGEVVLSEKGGYNPNVGDTNDWRKMERRDPLRQ